MHFASVVTLFAAAALAVPTPTSPPPSESTGDCEILKCAAALGPAGIACVASALQEGLDPLTDLPCIAAVINDVANPPESCQGCLSHF
jgi:Fungal calcium binding protein